MKIPAPIEQFDKIPALFILAGDYEARFLVGYKGIFRDKTGLRFSMREEGKEKQAYQHSNPTAIKAGTASHHDRYQEDLKKKFHKSLRDKIHDLISSEKVKEIYLFAPRQAMQGIYKNLNKDDQEIIKEKIYGEYTKKNPLEILKIWQEKTDPIKYRPKNKTERKIMSKPITGRNVARELKSKKINS